MKMTRIPYSLPMARARRAGLKTQTRRIAKGVNYVSSGGAPLEFSDSDIQPVPCPYGQPGDILLPIEPWRAPAEFDSLPPIHIPAGTPIWLDANGPAPEGFGRYRHARFMPKHLITARDELVAVRVERLQDISEADAIAEGTTPIPDPCDHVRLACASIGCSGPQPYRVGFRALWEQINGPGSWDANPWVWVLELKVITP